ncbi:MAG TPA: M1 family metallopeptidase [Flavobacteriaceae bacterium]|nr:M1 family metallopeptidase [Flavobacteriaceae bacterium]
MLFLYSAILYAQQTDVIDVKKGSARIAISPEDKTVSGLIAYKFEVLKPIDSIYIDARNMEFSVVFFNNGPVETIYDGNQLTLKANFAPSKNNEIVLGFTAQPKQAMYFVGWDNQAPNQVWTQGQGKYTSNWLPSFDDVNEKIEFDLSVSFKNGYQVISNGKLLGEDESENFTQWRFDMEKPMSSYLLSVVIGDYAKKSETSKSGVPLVMYYYANDSSKVEPTYRYTKQLFDFLEEEIGVAYPWQEYKQVPVHDFLYAGMENTAATTFADTFVVDSIGFADGNYVNVNAHELAHQWFGNLVTAKSSEHHWLQEGFSTYYALLAEKEIFGDKYYFWRLYQYAQELQDQDKAELGTSLLNPKSSSLTFYRRGCWVLHALREKIGDVHFKAAVKQYLTDYQFKSATTQDFIAIVEKLSETSMESFVETWIKAPVFPLDMAQELLLKSTFIQEYEMVDCEALNAKCSEYLTSYISDEAKIKIIKQQPELITAETFENPLKVRNAIAEVLTTIPEKLKKNYESLLKDASYNTIEKALYNLWNNFPNDRATYLDKTKDIKGRNNNVRQIWLLLALSTPDYNEQKKSEYFDELIEFTSAQFNFEERLNAFQYLFMLDACNDICLKHLEQASGHHNWRLASYAKKQLEILKKKS